MKQKTTLPFLFYYNIRFLNMDIFLIFEQLENKRISNNRTTIIIKHDNSTL